MVTAPQPPRQPIELIARAAIFDDDVTGGRGADGHGAGGHGAVLLCRASGHKNWFLPGGHVEDGETLAGALARELREEIDGVTGVDVGAALGAVEHAWIDHGREGAPERCEINHVFRVDVAGIPRATPGGAPAVVSSREPSISFAWVPLVSDDDALGSLLPAPMQPLLRLAHAGVADVFGGFASTRVKPRDNVVVRELAGDADIARLRRARLYALAETPSAFGSSLANEKDRARESWAQWAAAPSSSSPSQDRISLVAHDGVDFVGTATGKDGELLGMWVHPSYRGTDVATRLVDRVAQWTRTRGSAELALWVSDVNARARAFYRRVGFVETGEAQPLPSRPALRELRMTLRL